MNVTHLRYVALVVPELERSRTFFRESWGLEHVADNAGTAYFRSGRNEPFQLALRGGPQRRIERIGFALADKAAVDTAARELERAQVEIVAAPRALATPGGGYGVTFLDPDHRAIELSADVAAVAPAATMSVPRKLAHIVVNTTDIDRVTAFYNDVLGFRISDWSEHVMSFLRCDSEHHALAFNVGEHPSYNHTSWTMGSIDELFRAQGRIRAAGTPLAWGTGRHGPGNQVFNYFVEPSGFVVELIADGIDIADERAWQPQVWVRAPQFMDLWGTSGFPSPEIRAAMAGVPDPGHEVASS